MLAPDFLEILRCPETREPLELLPAEALAALNARIAAGGVRNRGGEAVSEALEAGLLPRGGPAVYPVRDDIPILLVEEAILL